ncbi:hypothetical protein [Piscinibacter sakaiensis]|uniref:Secreted protein n=1 Tax=Piscinibacter sakaiensis TaxID=1547922 RepID=A0A0K8P6C0_PISS1|nr:hypothetical protein [Piscinibacter sakaiensis]GAP38079.1 hypothetical protein ISF6_4273 [Piscinibacter sakaiensis]
MPRRLLALLLALLLLWSGASSHERLAPLGTAALACAGVPALVPETLASAPVDARGSGSLDEHHLDDRLTPMSADAGVDGPALPSRVAPLDAAPPVAGRWSTRPTLAPPDAPTHGPRRPPRLHSA